MDQTKPRHRQSELLHPLLLEKLRERRFRRHHYRQRRRMLSRLYSRRHRRQRMIKRLSRQSRQEHQPPLHAHGVIHGLEDASAIRTLNTACVETATTTVARAKLRGMKAAKDLKLNPIYLIRNWINNMWIRIRHLFGRSPK